MRSNFQKEVYPPIYSIVFYHGLEPLSSNNDLLSLVHWKYEWQKKHIPDFQYNIFNLRSFFVEKGLEIFPRQVKPNLVLFLVHKDLDRDKLQQIIDVFLLELKKIDVEEYLKILYTGLNYIMNALKIQEEEIVNMVKNSKNFVDGEIDWEIKPDSWVGLKFQKFQKFKAELTDIVKAEVKAELEASVKAELEARVKAELEARVKAELEARVKAEGEFNTKLLFISKLSKKMPKEQIANMLEMSMEEIDQILKHQE